MENKNGSGGKAGAMAGKGFYIVLFLCAAVIVASACILAADVGTHVEDSETAAKTVDISDAVVTMVPAGTPLERDDSVPTVVLTDEGAAPEDTETAAQEPEDAYEVFSESVAYVWPVQGGIEMPYAVETLLYDPTMADWRTHDGVDIACDLGAEVLAAASGTVTRVSNDDLYGTVVVIDHGNGVRSTYANLAEEPPVWEGEWVGTGQVIGSVGGTALAETNMVPHLHLSMTRDGGHVDPLELLPAMAVDDGE